MSRRSVTEWLALLLAGGALTAGYLQTRAALRLAREALRMAEHGRVGASEAARPVPFGQPSGSTASAPGPSSSDDTQASLRAGLEALSAAREALEPHMRAEVTALGWGADNAASGSPGLRVHNAGPATALELSAEVHLEDGSFQRGAVDLLAAGDVFRFADELRTYTPSVLDAPAPALGQVAARLTWMNEDGTVDSTDWVVVERA